MKILITGGAGFIGSHLCQRLASENFDITVIDNLLPQIHGKDGLSPLRKSIPKSVKFVNGDIRDHVLLEQLVANQDVIVHLAALTGTGQSMYQIQDYTDTNVNGTSVLLESIIKQHASIKKIILASSRSVYGEGAYSCEIDGIVYPLARTERAMLQKDFEVRCPKCDRVVEAVPTKESADINPGSVYAATKHTQEQLASLIGQALNLQTIILRFQNVYGPGQSLSNPYTGILSVFSTNIRNEKNLNVFEDGKESRDFVYIDDVVESIYIAVTQIAGSGIYNVGSGIMTTVLEVAEYLKKSFESNIHIEVSGNFRLGDIRHNLADITKISKSYGFKPKVTISEGLQKFVDWVKTQPVGNNAYEQSINEMKKIGLLK